MSANPDLFFEEDEELLIHPRVQELLAEDVWVIDSDEPFNWRDLVLEAFKEDDDVQTKI